MAPPPGAAVVGLFVFGFWFGHHQANPASMVNHEYDLITFGEFIIDAVDHLKDDAQLNIIE